ncbi:hypothetical protein CDAR_489841 [Caerostris darwini]|uniref:Uncharacterized protein n=1 Tax=Caerostris darwini TaxID=1538125 RepID=A0AAV4SQD3_9ARAC|nr:hypothetical protein CDAR_489841 [Caerostris darwini]
MKTKENKKNKGGEKEEKSGVRRSGKQDSSVPKIEGKVIEENARGEKNSSDPIKIASPLQQHKNSKEIECTVHS